MIGTVSSVSDKSRTFSDVTLHSRIVRPHVKLKRMSLLFFFLLQFSSTKAQTSTCSIPFIGRIADNNLVGNATTSSEQECKELCLSTSRCRLYTYHTTSHPSNPNICSLLSSPQLERPVERDSNILSGPAVCRRGERCQVAVLLHENDTQALFVEQPGTHVVELVAKEEECYVDVTMVAVGGGGRYYFYGGGGGSGYVASTETRLTVGESLTASIEVFVGTGGHESSVVWDGEPLLVAAAGGEEVQWKGGDGFSGGGGNGEGRGGSGGEDGQNGRFTSGGKGSGLQVELLSTTSFALSPGEGGATTWEHTGGGGGGGVLVNGRAPVAGSIYCGQVGLIEINRVFNLTCANCATNFKNTK